MDLFRSRKNSKSNDDKSVTSEDKSVTSESKLKAAEINFDQEFQVEMELQQQLVDLASNIEKREDFDRKTIKYTEEQDLLNEALKRKIEEQDMKFSNKFDSLSEEILEVGDTMKKLLKNMEEKDKRKRSNKVKTEDYMPDEYEDDFLEPVSSCMKKSEDYRYINAIKSSKWAYPLEFKETENSDIYVYINDFFDYLDIAEPDLTEGQKGMIITRRLPQKHMARLINLINKYTTKEDFFDHVKLLVTKDRHSEFSATEKFFEYSLKNQGRNFDIHESVEKLKNLATCLPVSRQEKERMIIDKLCTVLPYFYQRLIKQEYEKTRDDRKLTIVQKLWPCLSGDCLFEINNHVRQNYPHQDKDKKDRKILNVANGQTDGQTNARTDGYARRCLRCGLDTHTSTKCPWYTIYSNQICTVCKAKLKINLYHNSDQCKSK